MMAGMAIKWTGDVDADYVAMMVPHHQGAIEVFVSNRLMIFLFSRQSPTGQATPSGGS
jgi:hypothetical protein